LKHSSSKFSSDIFPVFPGIPVSVPQQSNERNDEQPLDSKLDKQGEERQHDDPVRNKEGDPLHPVLFQTKYRVEKGDRNRQHETVDKAGNGCPPSSAENIPENPGHTTGEKTSDDRRKRNHRVKNP